MSDVFEFEDQSKVERLTGTLHDPLATPGDVLTVNADGSVSAAPGGGSMPFQPSQLSDLALWLDASDVATINGGTPPSDGDPVTAWADKSDSGYDAAQATSDNQPVYKAAIQNGLDVIRCDPTVNPQFLGIDGPGLDLLRNVSALTIAAVVLPAVTNDFGGDILNVVAPEGGTRFDFAFYCYSIPDGLFAVQTIVGDDSGNIGPQTSTDSGVSPVAVVIPQDLENLSWAVEPPSLISWAGANSPGVRGSIPDTPASAVTIGTGTSGGAWMGDLCELIVVNRACNALEVRQLREYLSAKWAVL